jgi:two-component system response regulator HydG
MDPDALNLLQEYDWPGNVRELKNAIERAVVLSSSRTLKTGDFPFLKVSEETGKKRTLKEREREYILAILEEQGWNVTRSAKILGINRVTLHKKIKRLELAPASSENSET